MDHDDPFATDPTGRLDMASVTAGLMLAGRYRLEALLAHSAQVMSWRAADLVLSRSVLIHLLQPDDEERLGWVLQAARRAATVNDSRFLRVLDALEASGQEPWSFVVCEFAVGDSVQTLLSEGPLTSDQAGFIVHELAAALAPQHARGLFHRRISPDSVIITSNGNVKIVGFLIDAALRPQAGEDQQSWAEQEAIDTGALGRLLYAATTANWPVPPAEPQRPQHGLSPAPLLGLPPRQGAASEQIWPAPHEINRQINPELSAITMAILRPTLGLVGPSLHTADDIADSIEGVIGSLEAEESLENRVRQHRGLAATPTAPAVLPTVDEWRSTADDPDVDTKQLAAVDLPKPVPPPTRPNPSPGPAATPSASPDDEELQQTRERPAVTARPATGSMQGTRPRPVPAPPRQPTERTPAGALSRRGVLLLVIFVVIALVTLQVRSCTSTTSTQPSVSPTVEASTANAAPEPAAIVGNFDFDPPADGGSGNENSDQAQFAADGDPSTVWKTLTYLNNPKFGGLKPGVGMVFDLGQEVLVGSVTVMLDNQPNALQLMVPAEGQTGGSPPMDTVGQWQVIAQDDAAGLQVVLRPDEPVTTRWVMVYFTNLPPVGEALYRSGIAEAYVNRD